MPEEYYATTSGAAAPRRTPSGRVLLAMVLLGILVSGAITGWLVYQGKLRWDGSGGIATDTPGIAAPANLAGSPAAAEASEAPALAAAASGFEQRVGALEARLTALDLKAQAASGNAARAEGLLIALAARRAIERGLPLGYLEEQLKLRFGSAQPLAVQMVITAAKEPITLDRLSGELDALGGALADKPAKETAWDGIARQVSGLFVVRRDNGASARPAERLDRAKLQLHSGQVEAAMEIVARLPGAADAADWLTAARRYASAQRALDLIETAAILEPRDLHDAAGKAVQQPGMGAADF